jgi:cell division protein ZapA (FtsZ GTPase activity inhibitor)
LLLYFFFLFCILIILAILIIYSLQKGTKNIESMSAEAVVRRRTDKKIAKRKRTEGQTTIYKTYT